VKAMTDDLHTVLRAAGPRLRILRKQRGVTLEQLAESTGISTSTLSRLESGQRRATLELLLLLSRAFHLPLDELVGAPATADPRIHPRPLDRNGTKWIPLSRNPGSLNVFKQILPVDRSSRERVEQRVHEGYEWLYVISGKLHLALGDELFTLSPGEAAEFDTRAPHGYANAGRSPVELLIIYGPQDEQVHLRARTTR
jgi:transcriptional regulator with XRE-family HTH domain